MRTILIPTDFKVDSLMAVKKTLHVNNGDEVKIILFHCVYLSDSITDLLMFSKGRLLNSMLTPAFMDACEIIRNKFSQNLHSLSVDVFTGNTPASFDNFLDANDVDVICFIENYTYSKAAKNSVDPIYFVAKANVPALKMTVEMPTSPLSQNQLAVLFSETA